MNTRVLSGRRGGKSAEMIRQIKQLGTGMIAVLPHEAAAWASKIREAGGTVTCVLNVKFPRRGTAGEHTKGEPTP